MEDLWWRELVPCQKLWVTTEFRQDVDHYSNISTFEKREEYDTWVVLEPGDEILILESGIWYDDNEWDTAERCPLGLVQKGGGYLFFLHEQLLRCGYFSQDTV